SLRLRACSFVYPVPGAACRSSFATLACAGASLSASCFIFTETATTEIYTLSLHDALPISLPPCFRTKQSCCASESTQAFRLRIKDRKSTRLNSSHVKISYAVFCLKKKKHSRVLELVVHPDDLQRSFLDVLADPVDPAAHNS